MKRMMVLSILCIVLIFTSGSMGHVSAQTLAERGNMPWRIEPVIQNSDIKSISVANDSKYGNAAPLIAYYDKPTSKFREAIFWGDGLGDCGMNNAWKCGYAHDWFDDEGGYNDVGFFPMRQGLYDQTSYVYSVADDNALYLKTNYTPQKSPGERLLAFGAYPAGMPGSQPSMALDVNGLPHIAVVVDGTPDDYLVYIHPAPGLGNCPGGDSTFDCETILVGPNVAADPSITLMSNFSLRIAYYDPINGALGVAYLYGYPGVDECGPDTEWHCIIIDDLLNNGWFPSIALGSDAVTYIGYYNYSTGALMLAQYVHHNGNCGLTWNGSSYELMWQCDQIDQVSAGVTKLGLSLAMDGTVPVLAYMNSTGFQPTVDIAQPAWRLGMDVGNCGPIDLFYTWYCQTLVSGQYPMGGEIDMVINDSGALHIAFTEQNIDEHQTYLWSARQYFLQYMPVLTK